MTRQLNPSLLLKEKPLLTLISLTPPLPTTITTTHNAPPSLSHLPQCRWGFKGNVKVRMMSNKTSCRRLISIHEDAKGKLQKRQILNK